MTSISRKETAVSTSEECFFCWTILKQSTDGIEIYRCPEKYFNNCKKYLKPKLLEGSNKRKGWDQITEQIPLCLTCHESSEKLAIVIDVLESLEQELREVVEFFNNHIQHFQDENLNDKDCIIGDVALPVNNEKDPYIDITFDSDNGENYCPSDNNESDNYDIPNEETESGSIDPTEKQSETQNKELTAHPSMPHPNSLRVCLERTDVGSGNALEIFSTTNPKQNPESSTIKNSSCSKTVKFSSPSKILAGNDLTEGSESLIDDIDIKYEFFEESYQEYNDSASGKLIGRNKQDIDPAFPKEIRIILTRLTPEYIKSQCTLPVGQRNLRFVKRKAALKATAILELTKHNSKNDICSKDREENECDPDFLPNRNEDCNISDDNKVAEQEGRKRKIYNRKKKVKKSSCSSSTIKDQIVRRLSRTDAKRRDLKSREGFLYPCSVCGEKFNYMFKLRIHMSEEHTAIVDPTHSYTIKCKKCGKKFKNSIGLKQHEISKHGKNGEEKEFTEVPTEFPCSVCDKIYRHQRNLQKHMTVHNKKRLFECEHCNKSFTQKVSLNIHQKQHTQEFNFPCDICELKFKLKVELKDHKKVHQKEDFLRENDKGTHYQCGICNQSFEKEDATFFSDHMFFHLKENPFKCKLCDKCFSTKVFLKKHHEEEHDGCFPCKICGSKLATYQALRVHLKSVHGEENVMCEVCGASFRSEFHLRQHARHGPKLLECDQCDKKFVIRASLYKHIELVHKKAQAVVCEFCGKRFTFKGQSFKIHMRTHSAEKPFECTLCDEKFICKTYLQVHMRRSHDVGKLECKDCGRKFNAHQHLSVHMRTHRGEKSFECSLCQKRFCRKDNLMTHMRFHTGEKPYKCDSCGKQFSRKDNLNTHVRKCPKATGAEME